MTLPVMRSPRHVDVQITGQCNLHCTYCSHFTSASDVPEELPMDVWREFFHELERATVMRITFSGGEPFIRPDFLPSSPGSNHAPYDFPSSPMVP